MIEHLNSESLINQTKWIKIEKKKLFILNNILFYLEINLRKPYFDITRTS